MARKYANVAYAIWKTARGRRSNARSALGWRGIRGVVQMPLGNIAGEVLKRRAARRLATPGVHGFV